MQARSTRAARHRGPRFALHALLQQRTRLFFPVLLRKVLVLISKKLPWLCSGGSQRRGGNKAAVVPPAGAARTSPPPGRERGAGGCKGKIKPSRGGDGSMAPRGAAGTLRETPAGQERGDSSPPPGWVVAVWVLGRRVGSGTVLLRPLPGCLVPSGSRRAPRHGQRGGDVGRARSLTGLVAKRSPTQLSSCLLFQDKGC